MGILKQNVENEGKKSSLTKSSANDKHKKNITTENANAT